MTSLANVTQRRTRKSLLGTHRTKRESILPSLSETLYSIYEEKKESNHSIFLVEERPVAIQQQIKEDCDSPSKIFLEIPNSPETAQEEPASYQKVRSKTSSPERSPSRKRLDSLFSPLPKDDSFIIHETMLANDESVLAITLNDVSPEAESHSVAGVESVPSKCERVELNSGTSCDNVRNDETRNVVDRMLKLLDRKIQERNEFKEVCAERIEELQKKIDESNREIDDTKEIKTFLLSKFAVPVSEPRGKENVEPDVANEFVQKVKSKVKSMKTPRQSRKPRASALLTPHSMSFCVMNQYENLLNEDRQLNGKF